MSYWTHRRPVQRARALDIGDIGRVSAELLDEGGARALTVRAAAGRLGVAPASLYSRVETVDDLFDLALDHALGHDSELRAALKEATLDELMLAYFRHLVRHRWAGPVISLRAPRGPNYLILSERMCTLIESAGGVDDVLGAAYSLSNFVIGSAMTAPMAGDERTSPVDPVVAPRYARLHDTHTVEPEAIVRRGLSALRGSWG